MNIVYGLDGDDTVPVVSVTSYTDTSILAMAVKSMLLPFQHYYVFSSIPFDYSNGLNCDFVGAPVNGTLGENKAAIEAMLLEPPLDKISAP